MGALRLFHRIANALASANLTLPAVAGTIATAIFIRYMLEAFVDANAQGIPGSLIDMLIHYPIWYLTVFLAAMLILATVGGMPVKEARSLVAFGSFIILLPPVIDFAVYGFAGHAYNYVTGSAGEMAFHYVTLLLFAAAYGVGIKTEVLIASAAFFLVVRKRTGSALRGALAALLLYSTIFVFVSLPVAAIAVDRAAEGSAELIPSVPETFHFFFSYDPARSHYWPRPIVTNVRAPIAGIDNSVLDHYSTTLAIFLLIPLVLVAAALYGRASRPRLRAVLQNIRATRIVHYFLMAGLGIYAAVSVYGTNALPASLGDWLALIALGMAILFSWLFAVWENDLVDVDIDRTSSPDRPLARAAIPKEEWRELSAVFLALAGASALLAGWYPFLFLALFSVLYHAYSCPPLRLKRVPVLSSLIIGANALLVAMAGFFLASNAASVAAFPLSFALGIFLIFALAENVKNIKDIAGDRAEGILTLPVLLGERYGKPAVGALAGTAVLVAPFFFGLSAASAVLAVFFAPLIFALVARKQFSERDVFLAYFLFAGLFLALKAGGAA